MVENDVDNKDISRREFLRRALQAAGLFAAGSVFGLTMNRRDRVGTVWQIDPLKCTNCGQCATECVLDPSAVRCVHDFSMCGYCDPCTGFYERGADDKGEGAENQVCPTGAISRRFLEDPYYEYSIDESLCVGCGRCAKGCAAFGNGSLYMQVRQNLCLNCNQCSIASRCPADAFMRIPDDGPLYVEKSKWKGRA